MSENEIKKIFSKNFNNLLKLHDKTQKDICDDLGYHRATVSEWARGMKYPRMDKVERLAQYFNVPISELIDESAPNLNKTERKNYYLDPKTAQIAQEIFENKDLGLLFDASRKLQPDELLSVKNLVETMVRKERGEND